MDFLNANLGPKQLRDVNHTCLARPKHQRGASKTLLAPTYTMHNVPTFFQAPHEHQGEHRELVGSCPEATASPNKAATQRSHQARADSTNTRLLEPQAGVTSTALGRVHSHG